ncbi:MAG TPA: hypothetical protein VEL79_06820 [Vicinamibacterales bacterium]|nr:hypothetical protein [Vicinamibacterales bacterium]
MPESGIYRTPALQGWQRTSVVAAAKCLREQIARTPDDQKLCAAYEGLLDLLDPSRRVARKQREMADARQAATAIRNERRATERRAADRRRINMGPPSGGVERRQSERRTGPDRRRR